MGKVSCEVCGSNNIIKEADSFVCQSCGTKYTLEAMRSMFRSISENVSANPSYSSAAQINSANTQNYANRRKKIPGLISKRIHVYNLVAFLVLLFHGAFILLFLFLVARVPFTGSHLVTYVPLIVVTFISLFMVIRSGIKLNQINKHNRELLDKYNSQNNYYRGD